MRRKLLNLAMAIALGLGVLTACGGGTTGGDTGTGGTGGTTGGDTGTGGTASTGGTTGGDTGTGGTGGTEVSPAASTAP